MWGCVQEIPSDQVVARITVENPWWDSATPGIPERLVGLRPRAYLGMLRDLIAQRSVRRAVLLMGPRRVGKTVLLHHVIQELLDSGVPPAEICYVSVDHPLYNGCSLERFVELFASATGVDALKRGYVFFDEIQYLRDWEVHLKRLVDDHPELKIVVSGSAAAALRMKSQESGAGRFTDFLLPPLTFHEYLQLTGTDGLVEQTANWVGYGTPSIQQLNNAFVNYLNFGGYPEVAMSQDIQADPGRFVKQDIIDKVLLRDLPSLYGVQDIQELNYLFTTLAYNTAGEISYEELSKNSGVAKNTIKRYITYLEAAFLIKVVYRIDRSGRRFQRANFFKVYLTNPSLRGALFTPIDMDDAPMGAMTETAIFAQWFHSSAPLHYARWANGEVDIVGLDARHKPRWAAEVKFSDRYFKTPQELSSLLAFARQNSLAQAIVTTREAQGIRNFDGVDLQFLPASLYCYIIGRAAVESRTKFPGLLNWSEQP